LLRAFLDTCPSATILAADLNSVPASWVYHHIRGGWSDVFLQLGSGVGSTYPSSVPWLRIDYLLTNKGVKARQFGQYRLSISDHDLLVADVQVGFPAPVE
jgi:endonuclease/exonuclease/phosphatase family metal-dependent hydrolase